MLKMKEYLSKGLYPFSDMDKEKKRDFRRISSNYKLEDNLLYKRTRANQNEERK